MKKAIATLATIVSMIVVTAGSFSTPKAQAVDTIVWCHCEPNGNCQTLELPQAALENAGHTDASGNPLHAGDHAGQCTEPTATPTVTPTATPTPDDDCDPEEDRQCVSPTATPTVTPTPTSIPENSGGPGDGKSDGRSDGGSSCPECTKASNGQVLGASTDFAATGTGVDMLMNVIGAIGGLSTAAGLALISKKK